MASLEEDNEISKTAAKRKFLLTDEDLAVVPFKLKPNPMNKGYGRFYLRFFSWKLKIGSLLIIKKFELITFL